jgi:hypothetical protein
MDRASPEPGRARNRYRAPPKCRFKKASQRDRDGLGGAIWKSTLGAPLISESVPHSCLLSGVKQTLRAAP